jgi:hypothetical protein
MAALARFAGAAKVGAVLRLPNQRRLATLVAFVYCLKSTAQDDALEVLEALLRDLFGDAVKADKKARLRTLKDLDQAAATLACACEMMLDPSLPDAEIRARLFEKIPRDTLTLALQGVNTLIRPADDVYYRELDATDASKPLAQREKTAMSWNCFLWLSVMPMTGTAAHPSG